MAWTTPATAVDGTVLTAGFWNTQVRDQFLATGIDTIVAGQIIQGVSPGVVRNFNGAGLAAQPGTILEYPGTMPPSGYLTCDGSLVSRTTYADLFAAIGTVFGTGAATLYALQSNGNLYQVDLSDVTNPTLLGDLGSGLSWIGLGNIGNVLYALQSNGNLHQVDLSDVTNPTLLGDLGSGDWYGLGNIGNVLYALQSNGNLYQVDLSDVTNPTLLGDLGSGSFWYGLGNIGNVLYALQRDGNLHQVDLSDVTNPTLLGDLGSSNDWFGLGNIGNVLYALQSNGNLHQVDLSDVTNPTLLGDLGSGNDWFGLGNVPGASDSFLLPTLTPDNSNFIAVMKT